MYFILVPIILAAVVYFGSESKEAREVREEKERLARQEKEVADALLRKRMAIEAAKNEANRLRHIGAIFTIGTGESILGYHCKPIKWVNVKCENRGTAENELALAAASKNETANALLKLSFHLRDERYQAGTGPKGNPYFRNKKVKIWEAMACEAIPINEVDRPRRIWRRNLTLIDGSNVIYWGRTNLDPDLVPLQAVIDVLHLEGSRVHIVFDANVGYKLNKGYLDVPDLKSLLNRDVDIEIVKSGTTADNRLSELALDLSVCIVTNDLYRDSIRSRHIPKRRGYFSEDEVGLLEPRT